MREMRRLTQFLTVLVTVVFFLSVHATADSTTFNFTGAVTCVQGSCLSPTGTVTGAFSNDFSTSHVVGTWSFLTPLGTITSSGAGALGSAFLTATPNIFLFDFCNDASCDVLLQLLFSTNVLQNGGPVILGLPLANGNTLPSGICVTSLGSNLCNPAYQFTSGTLLTTPEPSSLVLLLTGVIGVGASCCRKYLGY